MFFFTLVTDQQQRYAEGLEAPYLGPNNCHTRAAYYMEWGVPDANGNNRTVREAY